MRQNESVEGGVKGCNLVVMHNVEGTTHDFDAERREC